MKHNFILVGMPGSGKTTIGKLLAKRVGCRFVDTDEEIIRQEKIEISEIFNTKGEAYFRELETEIIRKFVGADNIILSVGGGAFQKEKNRALLKEIGSVVYLKATPVVIFERIKNDSSRPLLRCENPFERIKELYELRREAYEQAEFVLETDCMQPEVILENILRIINGKTVGR